MKKNQVKLVAVLSTAAFMAVATPELATMEVFASTVGWVQEDDELRFYDSEGYYQTDVWKKNENDWYYLDEDGYITRSKMVDEYYVGTDGKRIFNDWVGVENEDYFFEDDEPETYWYYYGSNGKFTSNRWLTLNGRTYYFNDDGHMQTGILELGDYIYYLGEEGDGGRHTGWVKLYHETDRYGEEPFWHYFDANGRLIMNHVDYKIGSGYYAFENGVMQTGWYKLPVTEVTVEETATASDATITLPIISQYQYYKEDGTRADGWFDLEGVPEVSDEFETFKFFFKNGVPYYAHTGIQTFTVDAKRYGFNTKGEMQTGLQLVTNEDHTTSTFYFGDDGVMRTGRQTIYNEDLDKNEVWFFYTEGGNRGRGFHGVRDNSVYDNGLRLDADRDMRIEPVTLDGVRYLVNSSGALQKASNSSKSTIMPDLGPGFKDVSDANDKVWVVDTDGKVQS